MAMDNFGEERRRGVVGWASVPDQVMRFRN